MKKALYFVLILLLLSCDVNNLDEKRKKQISVSFNSLSYYQQELFQEYHGLLKTTELNYIKQKKKIPTELYILSEKTGKIVYLLRSINEKISPFVLGKEAFEKPQNVASKVNSYLRENEMIDSLKTALNKHNVFLKSFCKNEKLDLEVPSFANNPQKVSFNDYYFSNAPSLLILCSLLQFEIDVLTTHKKIMLSYIEKHRDEGTPKIYSYFSVNEHKKQWYVGDTFTASVDVFDYVFKGVDWIKVNDKNIFLKDSIERFTLKGELPYGKKKLDIKIKYRGNDSIFQKEIEYEVIR